MDDMDIRLEQLTVGHEIDTKRLSAAFFAEDDIGAMVRCHFELEKSVVYVLEKMTQGRWKKLRSQYLSEKLNLLEVLGAPPKLLSPVRTLNNQRNDFAHEGLEEISEQQFLDLVRGVRAFYPNFHDDYSIEFNGKKEFKAKFSECNVRQRYVVTAAILTMLIAGIPELMAEYFRRSSANQCGDIAT